MAAIIQAAAPSHRRQVRPGALAKGRNEAPVVIHPGGQHDVARLDTVKRNSDEVGANAADGDAGRDDHESPHCLQAGQLGGRYVVTARLARVSRIGVHANRA